MKSLCRLGGWFAVLTLVTIGTAQAEFKVRSPIVEKGELAIEQAGSAGYSRSTARNNELSIVHELEYGLTDFLKLEVEGEWARDAGPGADRRFKATTFGALVEPFAQGELWLDAAFWVEYGRVNATLDPDTIKFGPVIQKSFDVLTVTGNFYVEKQLGIHSSGYPVATYAAQFRYDWLKQLAPAVEVFGQLGDINGMNNPRNQQHRIGPVLTGTFGLGGAGEFKYELGYLAGLTNLTADHTVKWKAEYEIAF
jgi:hypothetical protein